MVALLVLLFTFGVLIIAGTTPEIADPLRWLPLDDDPEPEPSPWTLDDERATAADRDYDEERS